MNNILTEAVHTLFSHNPNPSPDEIAKGLAELLDVQQEWAVAEYAGGGLDSIIFQDYEFGSVYRHFLKVLVERNEIHQDSVDRSVGMVTRIFTRWRKHEKR